MSQTTSGQGSAARVHLKVAGSVQGVGFRDFVQRRARAEQLTGWVRNLAGGEVECVAEGDQERLERFIAAVRSGPSAADVRDVDVEWDQARGDLRDFEVVY